MKKRGWAVALVVAAAIAGAAHAGEVQVALDQSRPITLPDSATGVVIGNPSVAGVSIQNDRLLFVTGKSYGSTNLIVVGPTGRPILEARVTVIPDETNVVMVTRGAATARLDCNPTCRRKPDISDEASAFVTTNDQITARTGQAQGGAGN